MARSSILKGSPEAFAWAERMRLARQARGKRIRRAGRKAERKFFRKGKLKPFAGMEKMNPKRPHGTFTRCVKDVKKSLKKYHRKGDPKAICGAALRKNPIAIIGNPPQTISARVAGIIYNRVIEIRAQKTTYNKGFYRHPFETEAQILALDNGDLLIHSVTGMRLWGRS